MILLHPGSIRGVAFRPGSTRFSQEETPWASVLAQACESYLQQPLSLPSQTRRDLLLQVSHRLSSFTLATSAGFTSLPQPLLARAGRAMGMGCAQHKWNPAYLPNQQPSLDHDGDLHHPTCSTASPQYDSTIIPSSTKGMSTPLYS